MLAASLSLYVYSGNSRRGSAPLLNSNKGTEKNEMKSGPQESPSGIIDTGAGPTAETKGIVPVMDAPETPSGQIVQNKVQAVRPQGTIDVLPAEEIKDKEDNPRTLTSETPHLSLKRIESGVPAEKEKERAAAKKELTAASDTSREAAKSTAVDPEVMETGKPVDKPDIVKEDQKSVTSGKEVKSYVAQVEPAVGKPNVAGEKKDGVPAVGVPVEKEKERAAAKNELTTAADTSREAAKSTAVEPEVKETGKPVDKPDIVKEDQKSVTSGKEVKANVAQVEPAVEKSSIAGEHKEAIPAGGLNIVTAEMPPPIIMNQSSAGTKDIIPDGAEKQISATMETPLAVNRAEKSDAAKDILSQTGETKSYKKKPGPSPMEMLTKVNNKRIVIFPFENLSDNRDAFKHVLPLLIDKLSKRGFEVVDDDDLTDFLCKERIRTTGYISRELSGKVRKRFNASAVLTGAIVSFSTDEIPEFGVLARLIDTSDGTIIWADYTAATGEDFIAVLELGRLKTVFSLIPKVIDILFASFNAEDLNGNIKPVPRIAVMPFKNNTEFNNAGIITTYMFIVEILRSKQFLPIEYGDTRDIIIKQGIRRKGDIGYENIGELSTELKARGIVVGVVDNYSDGAVGSTAPSVGITARLVDGSNKKILWYNSYRLSGEENIIALDWGRIRSVHSVAYRAVSRLVKEMSKKKWTD
ncbi:MAG: hypothetical protein C4581_00745 [Nitrospiraceae bacterium]|nr:MAG: hypothetical protein C4581_00745 [Nitrospiraceae bacterium]